MSGKALSGRPLAIMHGGVRFARQGQGARQVSRINEQIGQRVVMAMTSPACPLGAMITDDAKAMIAKVTPPGTDAVALGQAWAFGAPLAGGLGAGLLIAGDWRYDAALHAVLVGFVLAMMFGHAPIVLPAVAGLRVPYSPAYYAPLVLLHASLALRVVGDLAGRLDWRIMGGNLNAVALGLFVLLTLTGIILERRRKGRPAGSHLSAPDRR